VSPERGLLDTSVVIGLEELDLSRLPASSAISSLTLAELASGPHAARDASERARRQERVQQLEAKVETLQFDDTCARAYGRIYAQVVAGGRKPRGPRAVDLMIAATAMAYQLPLFTLNAADLRGLDELVEIVDLSQ
jgi:predicted nucleic acid-binding protein